MNKPIAVNSLQSQSFPKLKVHSLGVYLLGFLLLSAAGLMAQDKTAVKAVRTWTDNTGQFTIQAMLIKVSQDEVVLKTTDNREITLPINKLSPKDIEYIRSRPAEKPADGDSEKYLAEFNNAIFAFDIKKDGSYDFFPLGLDPNIKIDSNGKVTGPIAHGTWKRTGNNYAFTVSGGGTTLAVAVENDIKILKVPSAKIKVLEGRVFKHHTLDQFIKRVSANRGGNGNNIRNPNEFVQRLLLACDGGDLKTILEFSYMGMGPTERSATLKAMPRNPKVLRVWNPQNGQIEPNRALGMMKSLRNLIRQMQLSKFDVKTMRIVELEHTDDIKATVVDKNGVKIDLVLDDVLMTPIGAKMFDIPQVKFSKSQ